MLKQDQLTIGGKVFNSRLIVGTGKYKSLKEMVECLEKSESEMVTVAIRRLNLLNVSKNDSLITAINWKNLWLLPNTAGAKTAEEAIRLAFLGRELAKRIGQKENNFIKLEVISDPKYLFPDPIGTLKAAEFLVKKGFIVLPYTNTDPMLAKHLEDIGCSTIMPLGSPIGSGQGIQSINNIQIIIENSKIPVIIDAGIGSPSEAALAMELGAEAVLINTAIAQAKNSIVMAKAMNLAVQAGRQAYLAGQMFPYKFAQSSSPLKGSDFLNLSKK
uniref:Thiazole biosynthesis protein ThiG n=1 Tax=Dictyoneurum californicum TaxID=169784 RepID=UPI002E75FD94|nr:Thiazole biosynthesis protein ThiG [Dictyoneurum californicum]WAM63071.1 Thiazole biosynthesis protein ThiG [Dictyoneurum californicum]